MKWEIGDKLRILDASEICKYSYVDGEIVTVVCVENGLPLADTIHGIWPFNTRELSYVERITNDESKLEEETK